MTVYPEYFRYDRAGADESSAPASMTAALCTLPGTGMSAGSIPDIQCWQVEYPRPRDGKRLPGTFGNHAAVRPSEPELRTRAVLAGRQYGIKYRGHIGKLDGSRPDYLKFAAVRGVEKGGLIGILIHLEAAGYLLLRCGSIDIGDFYKLNP